MFYYPATPLLFIALQLLFMDIPHYWKHTKANTIPATVKLQQVFYKYAIHGDKVIDIGCACGDVCE